MGVLFKAPRRGICRQVPKSVYTCTNSVLERNHSRKVANPYPKEKENWQYDYACIVVYLFSWKITVCSDMQMLHTKFLKECLLLEKRLKVSVIIYECYI